MPEPHLPSADPASSAVRPQAGRQTTEESALAELMVAALQLEIPAAEIDPEAPLFGEGLGLDSIDALELALAVSRGYGVELRSDDQQKHRIFASLRSLAAHIAASGGTAARP